MKNKFILFAILFIVVFCAVDDKEEEGPQDPSELIKDDEYKEYFYQGEEAETCVKKTESFGSVSLPDGYKCCLQTFY